MSTSEADRLEQQAEAQRAALSTTLERLRDNIKPDNLAQEALQHVYGDGTAAMGVLGRATRENPVPTALIGAGFAMLLGLGRQIARPAPAETVLPLIVASPERDGLRGQIRARPLLFGALGVAVGAALGTLIS